MAVVFDVDNTLFDSRHREKLLPNWDAYHLAAVDDQPIAFVRDIAIALWQLRHHIIIVTAIPERLRALTIDRLKKHGIPHHKLLMAPDFDERPSHVVKRAIALGDLADVAIGDGISGVFDNHPQDVAMWRELGFQCLQVRYPA